MNYTNVAYDSFTYNMASVRLTIDSIIANGDLIVILCIRTQTVAELKK